VCVIKKAVEGKHKEHVIATQTLKHEIYLHRNTLEKGELEKADARHFRCEIPSNILINKKECSDDVFLLTFLKTVLVISAGKKRVTHASPTRALQTLSLPLPHPTNSYLQKYHHAYFMWLEEKSKDKQKKLIGVNKKQKMKSLVKIP
jgi:hypothetical protein